MTKLTELEKQKVITCVCYQMKRFTCDRYKLELIYDKFEEHNKALTEELEHTKEMEEFYSNLVEKLKEVL